MYRYLALVWNPSDAQASLAARALAERLQSASPRWLRALYETGIAVFHADLRAGASETRLLEHAAGAVCGKIFTRDLERPEAAACVTFDETESAKIVATGGRRLFEAYWGRYVAIVRNGVTGEVWVLRDPSGGFPCLLTTYEGVSIVCSDIEDCCALRLPAFTVNWSYIAGFVAHAALQVRDTALNEVSEVQPGERLRFSSGSVQRTIEWSPIDIARSSPVESADEAVAALRATTVACVHAWAACYDAVIHNLSGGLDSSIVLSCLKSAPSRPAITCLNYFALGPYEDERKYARIMAERVGASLVEHQLDASAVRLEEILRLRPSARPWFYLYELEHGPFEVRLAAQRGASGLFSGAGGDGVFFQARAELAVTDYLFDHGFGAGLLRTAVDAARVSRQSIWPLLAQAVRTRILGRDWDPNAMAKPLPRTIVNNDVVSLAKRNKGSTHPWLTPEATRGVAPGILWHILSVSMPPAYYSAFRPGGPETRLPERTMPLLSQPLVELCLRIPTYVLIKSGRDRAMARQAFAHDLPETIVRRQAKGRADQHARDIMDANLGFVRALLLDGELVKRGLLNRPALELYLNRERSPADYQYSEILQEHLCTEAWLRSWPTSSLGPGR